MIVSKRFDMALYPGICSALTPEVVEVLRNGGVNNVIDFITADAEKLSQDMNLAYKDVCSIRRILIAENSSLPLSGVTLYQEALNNLSVLPLKNTSLDSLIDGGIYTGELTEIYGDSASGKTKLCLQSVAATVASSNQTAVFLDSGKSFDIQAVIDMLCYFTPEKKQLTEDKVKDLCERVQVYPTVDVFDLFAALHSIRDGLTNQTPFFQRLKLVVVDNVASVINPIMGGGDFSYGQSMVCQIGLLLKEIASSFSVAVLVTNKTVSSFQGSKRKVALGQAWSHVPHTRILISRLEDAGPTRAGGRKATLVKSRRQSSPASSFFSLAYDEERIT